LKLCTAPLLERCEDVKSLAGNVADPAGLAVVRRERLGNRDDPSSCERNPGKEGPVGIDGAVGERLCSCELAPEQPEHAVLVLDEAEGAGIAEEQLDAAGIVGRPNRRGDQIGARRHLRCYEGVY
jgi:hypothetical protein